MKLALEKEFNEEYIEAVVLYEKYLSSYNNISEDVYSNLAFLFWVFAAGYGFANHYNISKELREKGSAEYPRILKEGLGKHLGSLELKFWSKYFPHRHYFDEFEQQECEQMIKENNGDESLVPYFFLYLFDESKYKSERDRLLAICNAIPNAKYNYIKSIIE